LFAADAFGVPQGTLPGQKRRYKYETERRGFYAGDIAAHLAGNRSIVAIPILQIMFARGRRSTWTSVAIFSTRFSHNEGCVRQSRRNAFLRAWATLFALHPSNRAQSQLEWRSRIDMTKTKRSSGTSLVTASISPSPWLWCGPVLHESRFSPVRADA
jgi:hypothetical protein